MINNFFDMVKYWTISDYKTPGIKAEVILDMLISEFIEDLIGYHHCDERVTLLAKEFPIRTNDENFLNAKVDYLVNVGNDILLLAELKTTVDSFSDLQKDRMKKAIDGGVSDMLKFYDDICEIKSGNSLDSQKYKYQRSKYDKKAKLDRISCIDYLYILLIDDKRLDDDKKLILTNYCKDGCKYDEFRKSLPDDRCELWDKVSDILWSCAHCFDENISK